MDDTTFFAAVLTVAAAVAAFRYRPAGRVRSAHRWARTVDLALPPALEQRVATRLARRELVAGLGAVVGAWVAALALAGRDPSGALDVNLGPLGVVLAFFLGHAAGYGLVAVHEATRRPPQEGPRVARASTPGYGDYVAPLERWGAWGSVAVLLLVAGALLVLDARAAGLDLGSVPTALLVLPVALPLAVAALGELAAARLVRQGQAASTTLELAWDDALRSRTLRDITTLTITTAAVGPFVLLGAAAGVMEGGWPANRALGIVIGATGLLLLAWFVVAVVSTAVRPQRWFRRRLWSAPAAPQPVGAR